MIRLSFSAFLCYLRTMKGFENIRYVYFLGIGGIGMSALARWFLGNGFIVGGYDRENTPITKQLIQQGAQIHFEDSPKQIPGVIKAAPDRTLVVFTPAIPQEHQERQFLLQNGFRLFKRSEILGKITQNFKTLAVAGTHGKTTTSSLLTHILHTAKFDITAFVGGMMSNYESNFIPNLQTDAFAIVEADEFDRSFLQLHPQHAILTTAEADHLDIYENESAVEEAFAAFLSQVSPTGQIWAGPSVPASLLEGRKNVLRYGENHPYSFKGLRQQQGQWIFDWQLGDIFLPEVPLVLPGKHNLENATAAAALALQVGVKPDDLRLAMRTYRGVKRRFEFVINRADKTLIDDYAHHPTEVRAAIEAAKTLFPKRELTVIFQPHLFTRTRDFADGFAESLNLADRVILMDIYPAREKPIEGVSSDLIARKITKSKVEQVSEADMDSFLREHATDWSLVMTLGAGSIYRYLPLLKEIMDKK
ncbi:MAG: UDP-N-acetylmuramate--L-alanine ligase [Bacteroidota bacterium]